MFGAHYCTWLKQSNRYANPGGLDPKENPKKAHQLYEASIKGNLAVSFSDLQVGKKKRDSSTKINIQQYRWLVKT